MRKRTEVKWEAGRKTTTTWEKEEKKLPIGLIKQNVIWSFFGEEEQTNSGSELNKLIDIYRGELQRICFLQLGRRKAWGLRKDLGREGGACSQWEKASVMWRGTVPFTNLVAKTAISPRRRAERLTRPALARNSSWLMSSGEVAPRKRSALSKTIITEMMSKVVMHLLAIVRPAGPAATARQVPVSS